MKKWLTFHDRKWLNFSRPLTPRDIPPPKSDERPLLLVSSAGGHFLELYLLDAFWRRHERIWVTLPGPGPEYLLRNERMVEAHGPTVRNLWNFARNLILAVRVIRRTRPAAIVTTGAAVGVAFVFVGRLFRVPTLFLELMTRVETLSLSGRLAYPAAHRFLVQWPELAARHRKAVYQGRLYDLCHGRDRKIPV